MPTPTTFGFEAEFMNNVDALAERLAADGLWVGGIHGYHCRCEDCSFDGGRTYRVQHDSSCGGEVISNVRRTRSTGSNQDVMRALQQAAVDADAEPGLYAGFHVHVGMRRHLNPHEQADAFWAYLRYEPILEHVAWGRWPQLRGQNFSARQGLVRDVWLDISAAVDERVPWRRDDYGFPATDFDPLWVEEHVADEDALSIIRDSAYELQHDVDRHSHLNVNTSSGVTWEFRIFNSTRSAWRMELYTSLACAFADRAFVNALLSGVPSLPALLDALDATGHDRVVELLARQMSYDPTSAPTTLTLV